MKINLSKVFAVAALPVMVACAPPTVPQDNGAPYRHLTANEINLAKTIFGNEINYGKVKVYIQTGNRARGGVNNGIYMPRDKYTDDYALRGDFWQQSSFIHEIAHNWHKQKGLNLVGSAIGLFFKHGGDYDRSYDYKSSDLPNFVNLGMEQQAAIIEDYFQMRYYVLQDNNSNLCGGIARYEAALKPSFPDIQTPKPCR